MIKQSISALFRKLGLVHQLDYTRYLFFKLKNYSKNAAFKKKHPKVNLPPDYLMYESFKLDYAKYYEDGKNTAQWVLDHLSKHIELKRCKVLDWGCGPGRIIRHMPEILDSSNKIFATDYNPNSIAWCHNNIKNVTFSQNQLSPPLEYESNFFNVIYGISIFTHLSLQNHINWINELYRISNKERSCLFITTHGDAYREILTAEEQIKFDKNEIVIRENAVEGQRVFGAFHPPIAFRSLIENAKFKVLEFIPGQKRSSGYIEQDIWLLSK